MAHRNDLTWFRAPSADRPGTTNLCYHALDRRVIAGAAGAPALAVAGRTYDVASLLAESGALAGVLRSLGVESGGVAVIALADPLDRALAVLAALRLGAVVTEEAHAEPSVVLTDGTVEPAAGVPALLRGPEPTDPVWQLEWEFAMRAGRTDPAAVEDVAGDAPALLVGGVAVLTRDVVGHDSAVGRLVTALGDGVVVEL